MSHGPRLAGLLLAAGLGRRFGMPKALVDTGDGPWVLRGLRTLASLPRRTVVVGAAADAVRALLPPEVDVVTNPDFGTGMGSSLTTGLRALADDVDAVVVMLVDLPDVGAREVGRVIDAAGDDVRSSLVRAVYRGRPGHPVLIGSEHFAGVIASAAGDHGARDYLAAHPVTTVECGDLATGADVDTPTGTG